MNKGKALISASWQKLETLIPDLTFIDGSKYLFQVQGESKVRFLESDTEPTATDENGILTSETGFPVKLTKESGQDIYLKIKLL